MEEAARNDPCPCGSGKKFKKCCMETSQPAPNRQVFEKALDRFTALLKQRRFPELMLDDARFDEVMMSVTRGLSSDDSADGLLEAFKRAAPLLWPEGLGAAVTVLKREMDLPGNAHERMSWAALAAMAETPDIEENPVARALFMFHAQQWGRELKRVAAEIDGLRRKARAHSGAAVAAEQARKLAKLGETPLGRRVMEEVTVRAALELAKEIDDDRALLALDEWIWLAAMLKTPLERLADANESEATAAKVELAKALEEVLEAPLVLAVTERARSVAADAATSPEQAAWYRKAVAVLEAFPTPPILGALIKVAVFCVTELEAEDAYLERLLGERSWSKSSLEPYRLFLVEQNAGEAAQRIARAQAVLEDSPGSP